MLKAKMIRVVDGDTIEVSATIHVRLDFIDAPETTGAEKVEGLKTKKWLIDQLKAGDDIELDVKKFDIYDRPLAVVYKDGENINGELLKLKLAEVYTPKSHNDGHLDPL